MFIHLQPCIAQVHVSLLSLWLVPLAAVFGQQCISKEQLTDATWLGWILGQQSVSLEDAMSQELMGFGEMQDPTFDNVSTRGRADMRLAHKTLAYVAFCTCFPLSMARKSVLWRSPWTLCVSVQVQVRDFSLACASELLKCWGHRVVQIESSSAGCAHVNLWEMCY